MNKNYPFSELREKVAQAQKFLVVLPSRPSFDTVAAGLSLYLSLAESGKNATIYSPAPMTVEFNRLVGIDRVAGRIQGTDLIITLDYPADQIEKVSYNDDAGRPNLVIQPKTAAPALGEKMASYSYAGNSADLVFTVGVTDLKQLKPSDAELLSGATIVNLDVNPGNLNFGRINLVDLEASGLSEITLALISGLSLALSQDVAQNLLDGVWRTTAGLSNGAGADTYEAVAVCLRVGAQKPARVPTPKEDEVFRSRPAKGKDELPLAEVERRNGQPPRDWLGPKIYKGSSIS